MENWENNIIYFCLDAIQVKGMKIKKKLQITYSFIINYTPPKKKKKMEVQ